MELLLGTDLLASYIDLARVKSEASVYILVKCKKRNEL